MKQLMYASDRLTGKFASFRKYFTEGLGDLDFLNRLNDLAKNAHTNLEPISIELQDSKAYGNVRVQRGQFVSPGKDDLPEESRIANIEFLYPESQQSLDPAMPVVIHLAATGDETYWIRSGMIARPLVEQSIASVILMNPYYGNRRPAYQKSYAPVTLSDQFKMNVYTILEAIGLARYLRNQGHQRICISGVSMGASMAASAVARLDFAAAGAICLGPYGPAGGYFDGILQNAIDWEALDRSIKEKIDSSIDSKQYVRSLMDIPDLRNFEPPKKQEAIILIGGTYDEYVPPSSVEKLYQHWPQSELRWVEASHTGAILLHTGDFQRAIVDSLDRL